MKVGYIICVANFHDLSQSRRNGIWAYHRCLQQQQQQHGLLVATGDDNVTDVVSHSYSTGTARLPRQSGPQTALRCIGQLNFAFVVLCLFLLSRKLAGG